MENEHKARFLQWLNRFARVPQSLRDVIEHYQFTEDELLRLKPQVEAKYKLKKEHLGRRSGA